MTQNLRNTITTHHHQLVRLTRHAIERIETRLSSITSTSELVDALTNAEYFPEGETHLVVKKMNYIEIADPAVKPDGIARGDMVVASVHNHGGELFVATVMVRKSWSKSSNYNLRNR
jgi:hypothetical protein